MMTRLLIVGLLAIFAGKTLANFGNLANNYLCTKIPVSYRLYNIQDSIEPGLKLASKELKDRILHRYCHNHRIIDFLKHSQNLTVILYPSEKYPSKIPSSFFKGDHYGERFLMKNPLNPNDAGVNISLVPEILNLSHEDAQKYHMFPAVFNRRNELKTLGNKSEKTYLDGFIGGFEIHDETEREKFKLVPGWPAKLKDREVLNQTLLPGPNSSQKEREVYVVKDWLNINETDGFHATVSHEDEINYHEYITVFYHDNSDLFKPIPVLVSTKYNGVNVQAVLEPGWFRELDHITKQTMTIISTTNIGNPQGESVTVYPAVNHVKPENGAVGTFGYYGGSQVVTIYYNKRGNPEDNPDNRREMYNKVEIVKQTGQSFADFHVKLSPGWIGVLDRTVEATMIPDKNDGIKSSFGEQEVMVTPGWRQFMDNSGFTAMYSFREIHYPISVELINGTKHF